MYLTTSETLSFLNMAKADIIYQVLLDQIYLRYLDVLQDGC